MSVMKGDSGLASRLQAADVVSAAHRLARMKNLRERSDHQPHQIAGGSEATSSPSGELCRRVVS